MRKPRINPLVPTHAVDRYLAHVHVATPFEDIEQTLRSAPGLGTDKRWTPALLEQTVRYARWRHEKNFIEYAFVMSGQPVR